MDNAAAERSPQAKRGKLCSFRPVRRRSVPFWTVSLLVGNSPKGQLQLEKTAISRCASKLIVSACREDLLT
jgi:hypothetical protein